MVMASVTAVDINCPAGVISLEWSNRPRTKHVSVEVEQVVADIGIPFNTELDHPMRAGVTEVDVNFPVPEPVTYRILRIILRDKNFANLSIIENPDKGTAWGGDWVC